MKVCRQFLLFIMIFTFMICVSGCSELLEPATETSADGTVKQYRMKYDEGIKIYFTNGEIMREFDKVKSVSYYSNSATVKVTIDDTTSYTYYNVTTEVTTKKSKEYIETPSMETDEDNDKNEN